MTGGSGPSGGNGGGNGPSEGNIGDTRAVPRVSVITPVWNAAATLAATIASVQAQTVTDWEMLIVDDGSTDGSGQRAAEVAAADPRLRLLSGPHRGAAAARNAGIAAARGRFIAFLDADDLWYPDKLATQLPVLEAGAPLVFSAYRRVDATGRPLGPVGLGPGAAPVRLSYAQALKGNAIGCLTAVYDTAHFGKVFMPDLARRQDYGLWLILLARGGEAVGLPQVLADYRVRPGSLSANKWVAAAATWTVLRQVAGLSRPRAAYCFAHYAARALRQRL